MNAARVLFTPQLLVMLTRGRFEVIENAVPSGARVLHTAYDVNRDCVSITVEHESLPNVEAGALLPILDSPVIRALP